MVQFFLITCVVLVFLQKSNFKLFFRAITDIVAILPLQYCKSDKDRKSYVFFFKDSLDKKVVTPTLKLDKGNVSTFVKFEYERSSSKTERVFKKTNTIFHFLFTK